MDKPIRVLCVFSTLDRGGAESMCMNLYRHIDREKVQFDFVKHTPNKGNFEDEIRELGGRIYEAPRYRIYNLLPYRAWWKRHLQTHEEHRIIHCHFFTMAPAIYPVARQHSRITIIHAHTSKSDSRVKAFMLRNAEKSADICFACSEVAGKWLFPHREFTVLNNAVDTALFAFDPAVRSAYRRELKLDDALVLGTVANFSSVKNPFGLIEIFKAVHRQNPQARLLWVGDGGLRPQIEQKLRDEGLADSAILTGVRDDIPALLQAMDVFLLPSFSEGLPVVLIEAQAAGLPCYVSEAVTRETDITGLCRFLPLEDPTLWAESILHDRKSRANTAQQIIDAGYDVQTTANWLADFYTRILENPGKP